MKILHAVAISLVLTPALAAQGPPLPNPYRTIENHFQTGGRVVGSTAGITIDRDGSTVWVFERCGGNNCIGSSAAPVMKFDAAGKLVTSFGASMFVRPHGIHVDRDGNVWVTDQEGHQVVKMSPEGRVLMTLGKKGVAGDGLDVFNAPSAVFVAPDGSIFIGDGHGGMTNARMLKFTKDGKFVKTWGKRGTAPGDFETPHGIQMDSDGRLFVADRGNNRVQIFDQDGKFIAEWKQFGRPSGIFIRNGMLYVADHQSDEKVNPGFTKGIRIGSVKDGTVTAFIPDTPDGTQEGVAVDAQGNIYGSLTGGPTGAVGGGALRKYVRR
jgi:DNA-binding beta-propeller fold protein YncE